MTSNELIRLLENDGWVQIRVKGSHHTFHKEGRQEILTVPHPRKDLPVGTLNSILKTAGLK